MKSFAIALVTAISVVSVSAFAGRDQTDIMLQQQTIKRLQQERAKQQMPSPEVQQMLENCKKMTSQAEQS